LLGLPLELLLLDNPLLLQLGNIGAFTLSRARVVDI
jgi:hypothetical protein